jgi:cysteine desulfurase
MEPKDIYLDNAATTMPWPKVVDAVTETLADEWGNPSSLHERGRRAKALLEHSRAVIASALCVSPDELFFTSGGTESNNLAIAGTCLARVSTRGNVITSALEHPSVTKAVRNLKREGWHIDYIPAENGVLDEEVLINALNPTTTLISVMAAQNELGYLFALDRIARERNRRAPQALLHTDAVQFFGKLPFNPHEQGIDLASLSAHKIGGPRGIGALFIKAKTHMFTTSFGGGQERGIRSGTEAVFLAVGFARAVEICMANMRETIRQVTGLKHYLEGCLRATFEQVLVNSREDGSPYIVSFTLPGIDSARAAHYLSEHHVHLSTASACESNHKTVEPGTWRPKHPLTLQLAGLSKRAAKSTFRVSFFAHNTPADIDSLIALLDRYCQKK